MKELNLKGEEEHRRKLDQQRESAEAMAQERDALLEAVHR